MIDEKKLIKELRGQIFSAEVYNDDFDGTVIENLLCLGDVTMAIIKQLEEQPKISLENKTSDNMNSSCGGHAWIPVEKALPVYDYPCLVSTNYDGVFVALYSSYKGYWYDFDDDGYDREIHYVVAWMPLPKSYKVLQGNCEVQDETVL